MQAFDGLGQAFQGGGDVLALVQVQEQGSHLLHFLRRGFRHHPANDGGADVAGFKFADVPQAPAV